MGEREVKISFEEWYDSIQEAYNKAKGIVAAAAESKITCAEYMKYYTDTYHICTKRNSDSDAAGKVYVKYQELLEDYVTSVVMPATQNKKDIELMLRELVKQWQNYKDLARLLRGSFRFIERFYIAVHMLPTLEEVKTIVFRDLCYKELSVKARDAVIILIDKEREGEEIDKALLKKVLEIFVDMGIEGEGSESLYYYEKDFEQHLIDATASYYSRKASSWISEDSCPDNYMRKAKECLKKESERVSYYLPYFSSMSSKLKLRHEILVLHYKQLLDNEFAQRSKT